MSGDDRIRTGNLSPDKRVLCAAELRPQRGSAGGIRTHGLELMRLARTAAPLPRKSGRQESNLRSPAPETGGVASSPTARRRTSTPGGTRTRSFRVESPASSPFRPRGREAPAAGLEPALSRVTVARLTDSTTPERRRRQQDSNLRTARHRLRGSNALPCQLGHASRAEGEGVEPPRPESPPVFETGYRAGGSPSGVAPAGVEPATLRLRGGSSAV